MHSELGDCAASTLVKHANHPPDHPGSHHHHVHISGRFNQMVTNIIAAGPNQAVTLFDTRGNLIVPNVRLGLICRQDQKDISGSGSLGV